MFSGAFRRFLLTTPLALVHPNLLNCPVQERKQREATDKQVAELQKRQDALLAKLREVTGYKMPNPATPLPCPI